MTSTADRPALCRADERTLRGVWYEVLGQLTATVDGTSIVLGGPKQRLVLALLLTDVGHTLTPDRLIDGIWGDDPPDRARHTLQAYVSELRGLLDDSIEWTGHGYRLAVEPSQIDSVQFEEYLKRGREAMPDDPHRAAEMLAEGLGLWRGEPFADLRNSLALLPEIQRLQQLRLATLEERINADLALGRHRSLVDELDTLTREFPFWERFKGQHMLALYRCGRQAEALRAFAKTKAFLVEELGIDPSPDLQLLEEKILRQDPALDAPPSRLATPPGVSLAEFDDIAPFGRAIRSLELRSVIGSGERTVVYRAYQPSVGREVAVKVIGSDVSGRPDFIRRFEPEAQVVARLDHPHIFALYDFWRDPNGAYLVTPLAKGGSLAQRLTEQTWSLASTLRIIEQVGSALAYAHRQHVTHGALSPTNVLFDEDDNAYLADFAIPTSTTHRAVPDRLGDEPASIPGDILSFGMLIQRLMGKSSPENETTASITEHAAGGLERVLQRATAANPAERYQRVEDLLRDIRQFFGADVVGVASHSRKVLTEVKNPYKGLRAFQESDSEEFFGRDDLVQRLVETLRQHRLVAVVGPSGSGKSSLVRAGLIPAVRSGALPGSNDWLITDMFPGAHPFEELVTALGRVVVGETSAMLDDLMLDERGLLRLTKQALPGDDTRLLLLIDQFEELFSMVDDPGVRRLFLESLTVVAAEPGHQVHVVITLRADYFDRPLEFHDFGSLVEAGLVPVTVPSEDGLALAISRPARMAGLELEPGLVAQIVGDVSGEPGGLPLMQHALTELADRHQDRLLTFEAYLEAGGVEGALGKRAEELYASLNEKERDAAEQVFLRLVAIGETTEDTRRRVRRTELGSLDDDPVTVENVIQQFGAHRLLSFDHDPVTRGATVEVAHEALLREWERLRDWVQDNRADLRLRQRLSAAAREWVESHRDSGFLLTGGRLDQLAGWAAAADLDLTSLEQDYLESSLEARRVQEGRASRVRHLIIAGIAIALLVATGLSVFALSQSRATEEQTRILRAAELAAVANDSLEIDPELSILLAIEAVETTQSADGTVLDLAEEALHRAVLGHRLLGRLPHNGAGIAHFSPDGRSFVTSAEDPSTAQVWSVDSFELQLTLTGHTDDVVDAVFDPEGDRIATTSLDGTVRVWDAARGQLEITFQVSGAPPLVPIFSNDGSRLAATSLNGTTWVWELDTGDVMDLVPPEGTWYTLNLEFSPDDTLLAVTRVSQAEAEQFSLIYDAATGELVQTLEGHLFDIMDIGFTPDGARIVTAGFDGTVKVWALESGENIGTYFGHQGPVQDLQVSADGTTVASSGWADVLVWDLETFETKFTIVGHSGRVDGIDLSPSGDLLLTASDTDRTTRLWDLTPYWSHELIGLPGPTQGGHGGLAYSADGAILATGRSADLVTLWDTSTWDEISSFLAGNQRMEFDPGGDRLATAGLSGMNLHETPGGDLVIDLADESFRSDLAFGLKGQLATASDDGVRLWTPPISGEGEFISTLKALSVAIHPDGQILALSVTDNSSHWVEVRGINGGELLATLAETVEGQSINGLAFDHGGEFLATASDDTTVIIWDTTSYQPVHRLEGHTARVLNAAFDPIRPEVATASGDGTVKIWNVETGVLRITLSAPAALSDLAYSPDGRYLAAISPEGFVTVFMLDVDELVAEAQSRLTRWWTDAECVQYLQTEACPSSPERPEG